MSFHLECADELLSTTRAVRKRLDLSRPVPQALILDCIRIAQQAPTGSNKQHWRWIVVTDAEKRRAIAEVYRATTGGYFAGAEDAAAQAGDAQTARVYSSAVHLADHLHEIPALVIPCLTGRPQGTATLMQASFYASIFPAVWSFCLAARARGLGTALTTMHLAQEAEVAALLGIPDDVTQCALLPVAYALGDSFKPAARPAPESITFIDQWGASPKG
jgi:nitroreductase